ncbi:hypothetical protein [Amycolatopsis sp. NPDC051071]|uniref:hypothetical protein n=1 Tax=Amycolatopsis sp. NPDC051071 TaxID=3154637 RepID=UPI00341F724C
MSNAGPKPPNSKPTRHLESTIAPWAAVACVASIVGIIAAAADARLIAAAVISGLVWLVCVIVAATR